MTIRLICCGIWLVGLVSATTAQSQPPNCSCESSSRIVSARPAPPTLMTAVSKPFDQAPFQLIVSERLVNRMLAQDRIDVSPVRDKITGADVYGRQQTRSRLLADFRPAEQRAEIHLLLQGVVVSETVGFKSQAAVATLGHHDVLAVKPVLFDGNVITTRRAQVWVAVHNQHLGAISAYAGLPLLDAFARSAALNTANRQRSRSDAETAESLADRLGPEFNQQTDHQLAQLNRVWRGQWQSQSGDLWPDSISVRTTDSHLGLAADWHGLPARRLASPRQTSLASSDPAALQIRIHEDAINAALKSLPLAGTTFSEAEIRTALELFVTSIGGRMASRATVPTPMPALTTLIRFADEDPVRVKLTDVGGELIVRASVEVGGNTVLAEDTLTLPLSWDIVGNEWRWRPGPMSFAKSESGVTLAGMVESVVRTQLAASIPEIVIPRELPRRAMFAGLNQNLRLANAASSAGWLIVELDIAPDSHAVLKPTPVPQLRRIPEVDSALPKLDSRRAPTKSTRDIDKKSKSARESWLSASSPTRAPRTPARRDSRDPRG